MHPILLHHCRACSVQYSVPFSASVFSQIHTCTHCGATSSGINIPPLSPPPSLPDEAAMQQEELARLFSHNLTLSQPPPDPVPVEQTPQSPASVQNQPIRYISQHYHHSWHAVARPASAPVTSTHTEGLDDELTAMLLRNSIQPALLSPSQANLFRNADSDQRLRLLELWRISPPSSEGHNLAKELGSWQETSLQQEERLAQLRYEQMMQERERLHHEQQFQTQDDSMAMDSAAVQAVPNLLAPSSPEDHQRQAEPYILSGYEMLAKREYDEQALRNSTRYNQAVDPVYKSTTSSGMWAKPEIVDMENSYGAFAQMREYEDIGGPAIHELDQDMVL